jgi:hypothetical protein
MGNNITWRKNCIYMLALLPIGVQTKQLNFSHWRFFATGVMIPVVQLGLRISLWIFGNIWNCPYGMLSGLGETDSRNKPEVEISWYCPFKSALCSLLAVHCEFIYLKVCLFCLLPCDEKLCPPAHFPVSYPWKLYIVLSVYSSNMHLQNSTYWAEIIKWMLLSQSILPSVSAVI